MVISKGNLWMDELQMMYSQDFSRFLEYSRVFSSFLEFSRVFSSFLEISRVFSSFLEISRVFSRILELSRDFSSILECSVASVAPADENGEGTWRTLIGDFEGKSLDG